MTVVPQRTLRERTARVVYSLLWVVLTPAIAVYLLWRARRQPSYRRHWSERFLGRYASRATSPCIWIHAVSVGETRAAAPLVTALRAKYPEWTLLVTHMTPTGRETAETLFGDRVSHGYLAYDYPWAVAAFFRHWRPRIGVVMETEIWPNLMHAAARARTPVVLANARLSPKSLVAARRWQSLMRPAARGFARILAQTDPDAKRFAILTDTEHVPAAASAIAIIGNVKFDTEPPMAQRELAGRFKARLAGATNGDPPRVFLFASTRDGEEEAILDAWLRHGAPDANVPGRRRVLPAIVPRHPQRFDAVVELARARGMAVARRSDERSLSIETDVWIGDSMGELSAYYFAADLAYVGGSIPPLGGQNLIEAAAAGCPVLIGRNTFNFAAASDEAVRAGAARRVVDYDALIVEGLDLARDDGRRGRMAEAGIAFAASHRGATARTVAIIEEVLLAWGAPPAISRP